MTNTYLTGNPLGSTSPKDLFDNASNFDEGMNSPSPSFYDRFLKRRETWTGMEQAFAAFLLASGYEFIGDYDADGPLTITRPNQIFSKDGEYWRPGPDLVLPYVTVNNWVTDQPKFVSVGDAALRQALGDPTSPINGAAMIGRGVQMVDSVAAVRLLSKDSASKFALTLLNTLYVYDGTDIISADNGITILVNPVDGGRWKLVQDTPVSVRQAGISGIGDATDLTAYTNAVAVLGYIHFGPGLYTLPTITFDADVPVTMDDAAILTIPSGRTLTISGSLTASISEHFRVFGTISTANVGYPEWFGAGLGAGVNADLAACQLALDSCGAVDLMPIQYKIGTGTLLHSRTINVKGAGRERTKFITSGASHGGWKTYSQNLIGDALVAYDIGGFSVEHDGGVTPSSGLQLQVLWASNGRVHDIKTKGGYDGFSMGTLTGTVFERVQVVTPLNDGIIISAGSLDFTMHEVGCYGLVGATRVTNRGLLMNGPQIEGFSINHMQIVGCDVAGIITASTTNQRECPSFGHFTDCYFDSCGGGLHIANARDLGFSKSWFSSTHITATERYGVQVSNCFNIEFDGCQATNNAGDGLTIGPGAVGTKVMGGTYASNGTVVPSSGIHNAAANGTTIIGATCNNSMLAVSQAYGITNDAGSTDYIIMGNQLKGNAIGSLNNAATDPGSYVAGNIV